MNSVTSSAAYQKTLDVVTNPAIFVDTYGRLSKFSRNLDWSRVNPIPFLIRGTRGVPRTLEAAKGVWETVPRAIRAAGPEATARFLAGKDWSHIYPYSLGGSNDPLNGIFEDRSLNRARGNAIMKPSELRAAQVALQSNALQVTLQQASSRRPKGWRGFGSSSSNGRCVGTRLAVPARARLRQKRCTLNLARRLAQRG